MTSLCDFVFQYGSGYQWSTYPDHEIKHLNEALQRKQKTTTLPNKTAKKRILINFETMIQKNTVTNEKQNIRVLIFTKDFNAWMCYDKYGLVCFKPFQVYFLEVAFQQQLDEIRFYDNGDYLVDLKKRRKINEKDGDSTCIMRDKVEVTYTATIEEIAHQHKVLYNHMQSDDYLRCLCKKRIFDPFLCSLAAPSKATKVRSSSNLLLNTKDKICYSDYISFAKVSVDNDCPNAKDYEIYSEDTLFYSTILLCTKIEKSTNKYLLLQILKKDTKYFLWQKSSRIGYSTATTYLKKYETNINDAKTEFENKFYENTKNNWQDVSNFKYVPGKYDMLKMDLSLEVIEENTRVKSHLPKPVQELLTLITNKKLMNQAMVEMEYDLQLAPLGQLTTSQIREGYAALSKIAEEVLRENRGQDLIDACNEFYMKIPHNFGKKRVPVILTQDDVEKKMKMLEVLSNINIAQNVIHPTLDRNTDHPLDISYKSLECELKPLDPTSPEFEAIETYLRGTCGPTHTAFQTHIISIFACDKPPEEDNFTDLGNNYLLWHGSRMTNWIGILKQGLCIAPAEASSTGAMFGKGLYFADMSSKSINYCFPTKNHNMGILLLCEVSLGKPLQLYHSVTDLPQLLPPGFTSAIGKGKYIPTTFKSGVVPGWAKIPVGPVLEDEEIISSLAYNEYVVYSSQQVKMKYLILFKCHFT